MWTFWNFCKSRACDDVVIGWAFFRFQFWNFFYFFKYLKLWDILWKGKMFCEFIWFYNHLRYEEMAAKYNVEYIAGGNTLDLNYWVSRYRLLLYHEQKKWKWKCTFYNDVCNFLIGRCYSEFNQGCSGMNFLL